MRLQHHNADLATIWLLGKPVAHSLSPLIQNTAINSLGAKALYVAAPVEAVDFEQVVRALPKLGAIGANVTVPHKIRAFNLCDQLSDRAKLMGAVNTLKFTDDGIYGDNTDGIGWWNSLRQAVEVESFQKALVIGAGGAARAVCHTLCSEGFRNLAILNRTPEKAGKLSEELKSAHNLKNDVPVFSLSRFSGLLAPSTLVVQTTSVGLHAEDSPVDLPAELPADCFLSELIYGRETSLMKAFLNGGQVQDGLGMLCGQGAASLALWLERDPDEIPLQLMVETARSALVENTP